jgi:hypothetical protein
MGIAEALSILEPSSHCSVELQLRVGYALKL